MPNCKRPSKKSNKREASGNSRLQNVVKRVVQHVVARHGRVNAAHGPKRFAFISYKGGSGKTTECINTAAALAECGRKVLVVDCDAQGDASGVLLKKRKSEWRTVLDLFQDAPVPTRDVIQATHFKNLSVIPADAGLNRIEKTFDFENDPQVTCLADAVAEVEDEFDYVLFDCAGAVHLTGYAASLHTSSSCRIGNSPASDVS